MAMMLFVFAIQANAQDKVVTGKITDASGVAVSGVTIKVKNGKALGSSNSEGTFSVKVASNATLQFSSVGFGTVEMQVPASGTMAVSMKASNDNLNEVVVIGYGSAKKKDLTGAVATVSSKDFVKGAITTPEQLIVGKVAGVSVVANDGTPGSGSVIRIRGGSSVNASNDPLIVIDGVPLDNGNPKGSPSLLSTINPNDIETFTILKDASAAAIYGSRASNGVIIVTTKRGKSGKSTFNFSSNTSMYTVAKYLDVMNADQFRAYIKANGTASDIAKLGTANTDWQKEIYKTAIGIDNNLSVSGSIKKMPYRASLGYLNQQGLLQGGHLKRTTLSINVSPKFFKDHLKVDVNLKGSVAQNKYANGGAVSNAVTFDPTQPIYSGNARFGGYTELMNATTGLPFGNSNPIGLLKMNDDRSQVERSVGNIQFDYKFPFLPALRANLNLGYDVQSVRESSIATDSARSNYRNSEIIDRVTGERKGGKNDAEKRSKNNSLMEFYLNYAKETKIGRIDLMAGYSYQNFKSYDYNNYHYTYDGTRKELKDLDFEYNIPELTLLAYYARFNYSYKGKYLLTASVRKDASSRTDPNNRWGTFPSAAIGWRLKEESFLKNSKAINDLKLRIGYGVTGQQDAGGLYDYLARYSQSSSSSQYPIGTLTSSYSPKAFYPRKWEQTKMINAAIDFAVANNRITGTIEYYNRETIDLINETNLPGGANFASKVLGNVGTMKNEGVELTLNTTVIKKKDLVLDVSFNANYNKNTITKLTISDDPNFVGNTFGNIGDIAATDININSVGYSRGTFFVYKQIYDPKTGKPIEGFVDDINRDGNITRDKDAYRYKQIDPIMFIGFSANVTYKKITAGFVIRGSYGNYIFNARNAKSANLPSVIIATGSGYLSNTSTNVLSSNFKEVKEQTRLSDYYVENASFLRMDNINVGYNIGQVFNNKANLRLGASVQNVFVITKYTGLDPEVYGGIDNTNYARPRVFSLSLNLDF